MTCQNKYVHTIREVCGTSFCATPRGHTLQTLTIQLTNTHPTAVTAAAAAAVASANKPTTQSHYRMHANAMLFYKCYMHTVLACNLPHEFADLCDVTLGRDISQYRAHMHQTHAQKRTSVCSSHLHKSVVFGNAAACALCEDAPKLQTRTLSLQTTVDACGVVVALSFVRRAARLRGLRNRADEMIRCFKACAAASACTQAFPHWDAYGTHRLRSRLRG